VRRPSLRRFYHPTSAGREPAFFFGPGRFAKDGLATFREASHERFGYCTEGSIDAVRISHILPPGLPHVNEDPRIAALPDIHGHAKGEHKPFAEERPIPYTARMLFLWFYHACRRGMPRYMMVADHVNYLTFEDPAAVNLVRRALKLAQAGDLYGAAETAGIDVAQAAVVSEGLRRGMRYSIGAEVDNDPRSRPDAQNIVDAMRPDGMIRSVHFLPITHPQHGENWMWPFDNEEFKEFYEVVGTERVWELYMATLLDAIDKLPGHIVGHFYVPAVFGHWPDDAVLETYEDQLVDACAERGMAIEINSRYFYKHYAGDEAGLAKYRAVNLRLMRKAKAKGVLVAVGSDAHSPKDQAGGFDFVLGMLDEVDINEIAFPLNGRLARVALRATEELLRQQSAANAPPLAAVNGGRASSANGTAPETIMPEAPAEPPALEAEAEAAAPVPVRPVKKKRPAVVKVAADETVAEEVAQAPEAPEPAAEAKPKRIRPPKVAKPIEPEPQIALAEPVAVVPPEPAPKLVPARAPKKAATTVVVPERKVTPPKAAPAKASPAKKAVAVKKPVAKKAAAAKKPALKKAAPKKPAPKKAAPKKAVAKKAAARAGTRPVKKAAKKAAPRAAKRTVTPKRAVAKKSAPKKAAPKKKKASRPRR